MFDPRMHVEALKQYMRVDPVNTSLDTRSSRENSAVAENSSENGVVKREKMKWNGMEFGLWKMKSAGGLLLMGGRLFYS